MNSQVDGYLRKSKKWQAELHELRKILLGCPLTEEVKWRHPCYTVDDSNVVILGAFKEYCAMTFVKGVLLKDPHRILEKPGENTQSARVIRFTSVGEITKAKAILKALVHEAIKVEKAGLKVKLKKITEYEVPEELQKKLDQMPSLKTAFQALTPGRQRRYLLFFSSAKQSQTRELRIEKHIDRILDGKGMDD
jgi:uncharacterized protein YdeI (YjbR/CyaY-like superfamily)